VPLINEGRVLNGTLTQALVLNTNLFVDGRSYNTAVTRAKGVDFDFRYNLLGTRVGDFRFGLVGSRFLTYKSAPTSIAPETDVLNRITYPFKLRSRVSANWSRGEHWSGGAYVNYTNGYTNDLVTPIQEVGSYVTFDWRLNYKVNGWDFGLDTRNLFNRDPPFVNSIPSNNGGGGFDPNGVDTVGRLFAVSIGKKF
jgi:iron complex outermembrane receptor protein